MMRLKMFVRISMVSGAKIAFNLNPSPPSNEAQSSTFAGH